MVCIVNIILVQVFDLNRDNLFNTVFCKRFLGTTIGLTILLRDSNDLVRYFHLQEAEIPLNPCNEDGIVKIVKLLLNLRVSRNFFVVFFK